MIMLSKTYQVSTYESAEDGDYAEQGFEFEREPFSFRELVQALDDYAEPSDSSIGSRTWVSSYPETDYRTGAETIYSLHFVGPESKRKYWIKALNLKFNSRT
jgi:hypothetical protein